MQIVGGNGKLDVVFQEVVTAVERVGSWDFTITVELHDSFDGLSEQQSHRESPAMYVVGSRPRKLLINETLFMACSAELRVAVLLHEIGHAVRDPLPKEPLTIGMPPPSEEALADLFVAQCGHGAVLAEDRRQHWLAKGWGPKNADEYAACLRDPGDDLEAVKERLRKVCWKVQIGTRE